MRLKLCFGLLIVALLLSASSVAAGVYKWRDDAGRLHFTDDKNKIPLQYRSSGMEKMKGMIEPSAPPKPAAPPAETVKDPSAVENPDGTAETEPPAIEEEKDPTEGMDPKLLAILQETKKFLEGENRAHKRLIDFVEPDLKNGRYYVTDVRKRIASKKALIKKLNKFKLPSLQQARSFIKNSLILDANEKIGGEGYEGRIIKLKKRLASQMATKKLIIKLLEADLPEAEE